MLGRPLVPAIEDLFKKISIEPVAKPKHIQPSTPISYGADYWNSKWPKSPIVYNGRELREKDGEIPVDVKSFIMEDDEVLRQIIDKFGLKRATYNETAWAVQQFVVSVMTYADDQKNDDAPEYWQFPFESIASQLGDCEDGAILMASLMINAGIPNWRVKVCAGNVQESPTAPMGGHAYCIYLADRDDQPEKLAWEIHDWCYFEDSATPTGKKPLAKNGGYNNCYKTIWFTFNDQYSWAQTTLQVDKRVKLFDK